VIGFVIVALKLVTKNRVRIVEKVLQNAGYTIYRTYQVKHLTPYLGGDTDSNAIQLKEHDDNDWNVE
jgi:hypothetical protein